MAFASLFTLLDDIASVLDDMALMTKMAAKKTAGVVGDDLALNANQVTGVQADRELPIVWAVAKGSLINKVILIPIALLLSIFLPKLITPLLIDRRRIFICFEGVEKIAAQVFYIATKKRTKSPIFPIHSTAKKTKSKVQFAPILFCRQKSSSSRWVWYKNPRSWLKFSLCRRLASALRFLFTAWWR